MNSKINSVVILSILAFALIAGVIPTTFVNVLAQGEDTGGMMGNDTGMMNATLAFAQGEDTGGMMGNDTGMMNATLAFAQENDTGMTSEGSGNITGMTQGQTDDDVDDGGNDDGDSEEDKDEGEQNIEFNNSFKSFFYFLFLNVPFQFYLNCNSFHNIQIFLNPW